MKKIINIFLIIVFMLCTIPTVSANEAVSIIVDGSKIYFPDQQPFIQNGRTFVPARGVFEAMGANVEWIESENRVIITSAEKAL